MTHSTAQRGIKRPHMLGEGFRTVQTAGYGGRG